MLLLVATEDDEIINEAKDIRNSLENLMHETLKEIGCTRDLHRKASKFYVTLWRNDTRFAVIFRGDFHLMVQIKA